MGEFIFKDDDQLEWNVHNVQITDIRLLHKLYALNLFIGGEDVPVFINRNILEDRLDGYFLGGNYTRDEVLLLRWNLYMTKGYFIKIDSSGKIERFDQEDKSRYYVSFLEVGGPLGTFASVYKNDLNKKNVCLL